MAEDQNPLLGNLDTGDEPWSLEETQASILAELRKILSSGKIDSKTLGTISKNISVLAKDSKTVHNMDKQLKDIAGSSKKDEKHSDALSKAFKKESGERRKAEKVRHKDMTDLQAAHKLTGGGKGMFSSAKKGLGALAHGAKGLVSKLSTFGGSLKEIGAFAGGGLVGALTGLVINQAETYQRLTNVGQTFGGSMIEMSRQAADAGLSLESVAKLTEKYSKVAANVGIKALLDHQKAVRKNAQQFGQWGMTLNQMTEFSTDHLEQMKVSGMFDLMTDKQRQAATTTYLSDLTQLSKITGKRREEIAESMKKQRESIDSYTAFSSLKTDEERKNFRAKEKILMDLAAQMPKEAGEKLLKAYYETTVLGTAAVNKFVRETIAIGGETGKAMSGIADSLRKTGTADQLRAATKSYIIAGENYIGSSEAEVQAIRAMGVQHSETARDAAAIAQRFRAQADKRSALDGSLGDEAKARALADEESAKKKLTAEAEATKTLMNLPTQLSTLAADMRRVLIEEFGSKLPEIILGVKKLIADNMETLKDIGAGLKAIIGKIGDAAGAVISNFKLVAIGAAVIAAAFVGMKVARIGSIARQLKSANRLATAQNKAATAANKFARSAGAAGRMGGGGTGRGGRGALGRAAGAVGGGGGIAGRVMGGAGKVLGGALRLAGKAFVPLAALMAAGNAIGGYQRAGENFGLKKGQEATAGQKASSAAGGVVSGLTMGLVDEKSAARWIGSLFGIGKDTAKEKAKEKTESVAKVAAGDSGMRLGTSEEQAAYLKELQKQNVLAEEANELRRKQLIAAESIAKSTQRAEPDPMAGFVGG